jgi:hypothetical protein
MAVICYLWQGVFMNEILGITLMSSLVSLQKKVLSIYSAATNTITDCDSNCTGTCVGSCAVGCGGDCISCVGNCVDNCVC